MEDQVELSPRNYQVALFKECLKRNTIIFLPTGAGKTFIAIMVLKQMGGDLTGEKHKVSIILVNTVALVDQHVKYIRNHTPFKCGGYSGEMNVDFWTPGMWEEEFEKNQVMVMTSEILSAIIRGKIFDLNKVNLLIFDECHHAVNDHSMRVLMGTYEGLSSPPKILGLTATLLNGNCKPYKVAEEVRNLEVTFRSKIATVDGLEVVVGYATNPKERLIYFTDHSLSRVEKECLASIDHEIEMISMLKLINVKDISRSKTMNLKVLEPTNLNKKLLNLLKDVQGHIQMFGPYGGHIACLVNNILLQRFLVDCSDHKFGYAVQCIQTLLGEVSDRLKGWMKSCKDEKERIHQFTSPKVKALFRVLKDFHKKTELCGLVFVEKRSTAKVLNHILKLLSKHDPDFEHVRSDFIVGSANNVTLTLENLYISKKNKEVLNKFINKETNILCTSQVLEEGIDIPKCTLVCKFDVPKDYRSYIQSKGRARHRDSEYYILVPENNAFKFGERYKEYMEIEKTLNEFLIGKNDERDLPTQDEIEEIYSNDELKPFYIDGPESAYIHPVSAISLLNRYCQSLQTDRYTVFQPEWYYENIRAGIQVTVVLPMISGILDPIEGAPMKNKKLAKRAAALKACIELYHLGELNECLLPKERTLDDTDVSFLFKHYPQEKELNAGLKKTRLHDIEFPASTRGKIEPERPAYLHIIDLKPRFKTKEDESDFYRTDLTYGFVTPEPLPKTCSFPIYIKNGRIDVSISTNSRRVSLCDRQIDSMKHFHFMVFDEVLKVLSECFIVDHSVDAESLFLVPVRRSTKDIDHEVMIRNRKMNCVEFQDDSEKSNLTVEVHQYLNKIVYPTYRVDVTDYLVLAVCQDMSPLSPFPNDQYSDFADYYRQKYLVNIVNKTQPLLLVKGLSRKMKLYKPVGNEKKRKWEEDRDLIEYLIPEMLGKREFPTELWIQGRLLPSILYRLSFMLRVDSLWRKIGRECGFKIKAHDMVPLDVNFNLIYYETSSEDKSKRPILVKNFDESERVEALPPPLMSSNIEDFRSNTLEEHRYPWKDIDEPKDIERTLDVTTLDICAYLTFIDKPVSQELRKEVYSPKKYNYLALTYDKDFEYRPIKMLFDKPSGIVEMADMYEALTTSKANDIVNSERMETLGDSFLKLSMSHYIALRFPQFGEGQSTQLKGRLVSNKNLFYLAQKQNIGGILKNKDLCVKNGWIPPGFCIPETVRRDICDKLVSWKIVNCLRFSKEEQLSGSPHFKEFTMEENEYNEDSSNDAYHNIDQCLKKHFLRDKCVADATEAILGAYLIKTGFKGCFKVVEWLGIIPPSENFNDLLQEPIPSPMLSPHYGVANVKYYLPLYEQIEKILGYTFNNKGFLLQAFTHPSYTPNRITRSYERLEFLGDAVLDFLVTCFIYELSDDLTPGDLTDLRSALVNNNTFASFVVRLELHKYMLLMNSKLQQYIDVFAEFFSVKKNYVIDDEVLILLEEKEIKLAEYVDVPKALGDLFEAIAGAIFLDSNYSLETVWKVFYKIMWKEIDQFKNNIPKNPVRLLYEQEGAYPEFGKAVQLDDGNVMVKLKFFAEGRPLFAYGFGSNKKLAKKAAAKIALRNL